MPMPGSPETCTISSAAGPRRAPAGEERIELLLAADEGIETRDRAGVEAALRRAFAEQAVDRDWRGKALEDDVAPLLIFEHPPAKSSRGFRDDDLARPRDTLQPGREIERLADDRLLHRDSGGAELADHHHQPRRDADPNAQRLPVGRAQLTDLGDDVQRRARCALRVVLARSGIAEMGEDAVAPIAGDIPRPAGDDAGAGILENADDLAEILGIEPKRQRRGRDQIAEHRGQLPALSHRRRAMRGARALSGRGKPARRRSRPQKPLPLSEREAELAQIAFGQFVDRGRIDVVGGEHVVEIAETEPVKRRPKRICHVLIAMGQPRPLKNAFVTIAHARGHLRRIMTFRQMVQLRQSYIFCNLEHCSRPSGKRPTALNEGRSPAA